MSRAILSVAALTGIYLLVLTSLQPGDIAVGIGLSVAIVAAGWSSRSSSSSATPPPGPVSRLTRLQGLPALLGGTLVDIAQGSWSTARYCLRRPPAPGLVRVPIPPCGPSSALAWATRVGIAPDSVVLDVDEKEGQLLLHVLDASDPDAVRETQLDSYRRRQRRVFP